MVSAKQEELSARRDALSAELDAVDAEMAGMDGSPRRGRKPGRPRKAKVGRPAMANARKQTRKGKKRGAGGPRGEGGLQAIIRKILSSASEPVKLKDLASQIKKAGYRTTSAKFGVIVGQRLSEMKDVKKPGRGLYAMK